MTPPFRIRLPSVSTYLSWTLLLLPIETTAATAADADWKQNARAGQCRGSYVEPEVEGMQDSAVRASAISAMSVRDQSTTLTGDVEIHRGDQQLNADFATIDTETEIYTAEGNIKLRQPGMLLHGDHIAGNLFKDTAAIDSASFLLHQSRVRGSATRLSKDADNNLVIESGSFTTCEPDSNTWKIEGKSVTLRTGEGYGVARDLTLRVKDVPVAYLPWLRFPIDDRRQSGFLTPSVGQDSDRGTDIAIPYYFNLRPNLDATYTLRNIWKSGLMHEGEVRYLNRHSENLVALAFLPSDDVFDDRELIDVEEFDEQDRWLAHINHRGHYGRWSSRINYTAVSDIDYLHDLGGFTATRTDFDRALGQSDTPALLRSGVLAWDQDNWGAKLELRSFQELNQARTEQYAVLPRLSVFGARSYGLARLSGQVQMTEFDRSDAAPQGSRLVVDSSARLPIRRPWGFLTPSVRLIHRKYDLDNVSPQVRDSASLTTTLASIDAGLIFERETMISGQRLLQTLEPRLFYLYAEEDFQDDLPSFDSTPITPNFNNLFREFRFTGYDRIGDADQLALGLSSSFYTDSGQRLVTMSLGQIFHFSDREVNYGLTSGVDPAADTSPVFTSITGRYRGMDINAYYEWDSESSRSNRGFVSLKYRNARDTIFNITYTLTDRSVQRNRLIRNEEETDISFILPLSASWNLIGRWNYGWDEKQTIESLVGLEYNDCCWKARVVFRRHLEEPRILGTGFPVQYFTDRRADSGIYFEFQLKGLASLGGRLDSLIGDAIPGYAAGRRL